jgi:hypothetical protein
MNYTFFCPNPNAIRIVSAACGRGKTVAACKYIKRHIASNNWLYVAPTKKLLRQTSAVLQSLGIKPTVIDGDTAPLMVSAAIVKFLKEAPDCGVVLLVTWIAYERLPYFHSRGNWTVIIDEVPQLDSFFSFQLPYNHTFLTEHVEISLAVNERLNRVVVKDSGALRRLMEKPKDDIHEHFRPLFQALLSSNQAVYVDAGSWTRVAEEHTVTKDDQERNRVFFLAMLKPTLFKNAILLGANVEGTMLYDWLKRFHGQHFIPEPEIEAQLRPWPDHLGQRLEIKHFGFSKPFSKWQANKLTSNNASTTFNEMEKMTIADFDGRPFLFALNKDRDPHALINAGGTQIPAIAHGLNEYQHLTNVFFGAALNREPQHYRMLMELGFSASCIQQSSLEVAYQGTMRSALRRL